MKQPFFLFLLMTVTLPVFAQTGDIQGTVYQRGTEKPVVGADVRITETEQTEKTSCQRGKTDSCRHLNL